MKKIILKKINKRKIKGGHPWIYKNEISSVDEVNPGEIVQVFNSSNQYIGKGYYNPYSLISVRLLTRTNIKIDEDFLFQKIQRAYDFRKRFLKDSNSMRVFFSESDGLPGLIIDKFNKYLVVQFNTLGINNFKKEIVSSLIKIFSPDGIYEKSDSEILKKEHLEKNVEWLYKNGPELIRFNINGINFLADTKGQKTGFFLDQRENAFKLSKYITGKNFFDIFSYTGNFSFHMLKGGAKRCVLVDSSTRALEIAREIHSINNFSGSIEYIQDNAFNFLRNFSEREIDAIVIDPPAMTKSSYSRGKAIKGYKELYISTLKLLKKDSIFAASSCTQLIKEELWKELLHEAFYDTKKSGKEIIYGGQPVDHPTLLSIYETNYLKFKAFNID